MNRVVGVLGTGEMGSAVGAMFRRAGYRVVTALDGRSGASRVRARAAGLEDLGSLERVLAHCDLFLSILPPAEALAFARRAAAVTDAANRELVYADCNAVAPETVRGIAAFFSDGSVRFVDAGIVGPAPTPAAASPTRLYVSGAARSALLELAVPELAMIDMGEPIGRASAIKMCYAAMNKGVDALHANLLLAARRLGVDAELMRELETSQPEAARRMTARTPRLPAKAKRFVGEMREIAATFEAAGVSGDFYRGAAWLYALLARSGPAGALPTGQPGAAPAAQPGTAPAVQSGAVRPAMPEVSALEAALTAFAAKLDAANEGSGDGT